MDDFDLQGQLDDNLGSGYNSDIQDNSQAGADYLQNQTDWNFGNYGDMWSNMNSIPDMQTNNSWGDMSYQPGSAMYNMAQQTNPNMSMPQTQGTLPNMNIPSGGIMGGIGNTLQSLFNSQGFGQGMKGLAALMEGYQNKKKASAISDLASQVRASSDPFGSQRPFYQQQLQQAVQNPYSSPIVANQVAQLQRAQAIKDAAAGRRSNSAMSNPAVLAAASQVAQQYMNSLQGPAGANIAPNNSTWSSLAAQGINPSVNGYMSPLMSALGYNQQSSSNTSKLAEALQQLLAGSK